MLRDLVDAWRSQPTWQRLRAGEPGPGQARTVAPIVGSAPSLFVAALAEEPPRRRWLVVAPSLDVAEHWAADLELLLGDAEVALYPHREALPYADEEVHVETGGQRVEALEAVLAGRARVLVTTARALQERLPALRGLAGLRRRLAVEEPGEPQSLVRWLEAAGYERVPLVEEVGQFSWRGGIVDVFGFGTPEPLRVEFWDDRIASLRTFDLFTQRSTAQLQEAYLLPVDLRAGGADLQPSTAEAPRHLLDLLGDGVQVVLWDPTAIAAEWEHGWNEVQRLYRQARTREDLVPPSQRFLPPSEVRAAVERLARWELRPEPPADVEFDLATPPAIDRRMGRLAEILREAAAAQERVVILCDNLGQVERLEEILAEHGVAGLADVRLGALRGGVRLGEARPPLRILTDHEIFRRGRRLRRRRAVRGGVALESLAALQPGDYVVHLDHGIGRFRGVERVQLGAEEIETLVLEYADGELLRVPVHRLDLIERWVGDDAGPPPRVHKLGGREWARTRRRAEQAIEQMAGELLALYAQRQVAQGHAFSPDTAWQAEMESAFLFEDTPDQRAATEAVKRDMESPRPMDRLIVGDVGYGKTEIAIRAAFKAVQDNKQVAVLVPTTILAEQHGRTFAERLAGYPVRIAVLSRLRTPKEQRAILAELADGRLDIVIGTHRLLQPDVRFHDLGLLVVDEEHRFGVRAKERLKQLKTSVDVLTLTATPIPRTLHLSLAGLRDLSLIQSPPRDRQPIVTHVVPWSDVILEDAIRRELDRGGQVFFLHNRVETIAEIAARVQRLVPEARVAIAHGQMHERALEEVMARFVAGEIDVLVCTSIIESGLDVPNANTLIVHRADQFGLAQLYQIRGRVGRSHVRAYCYLVVPDDLPEEAERRLRVLEHYTDLGSGFGIALKDLELRGAGNLLGAEQSGFVHAVGVDTYLRLLESAVQRLKGEGPRARRDPEILLDGPAYLPDAYIPDSAQKLHAYRRLARATSLADVDALAEELRDRYGPLPPEARTFLLGAALRVLGRDLGLERISLERDEARLAFAPGEGLALAAAQRAWQQLQLEVELRRLDPMVLVVRRRGVEPLGPTLRRALEALAAAAALAARGAAA